MLLKNVQKLIVFRFNRGESYTPFSKLIVGNKIHFNWNVVNKTNTKEVVRVLHTPSIKTPPTSLSIFVNLNTSLISSLIEVRRFNLNKFISPSKISMLTKTIFNSVVKRSTKSVSYISFPLVALTSLSSKPSNLVSVSKNTYSSMFLKIVSSLNTNRRTISNIWVGFVEPLRRYGVKANNTFHNLIIHDIFVYSNRRRA